tara:strand:- start:212 stop:385 length:174 start_codon:yes stop_codon:yes gene_type:complete
MLQVMVVQVVEDLMALIHQEELAIHLLYLLHKVIMEAMDLMVVLGMNLVEVVVAQVQ